MSAIKNYYHDQICEGLQEANEEMIAQSEMDQMMIADFEARKQSILESDIPAFFGPDPSMF